MTQPWQYNGQPFLYTYDQILAAGWNGFLYLIDNTLTGQKYIGKKSFHSRSRDVSKRTVKRNGVHQMQAWWNYFGSSKYLTEDIQKLGYHNFTRTILSLHKTNKELTYVEAEMQFRLDVLRAKMPNGEYLYYNRNIDGKHFRKDFETT